MTLSATTLLLQNKETISLNGLMQRWTSGKTMKKLFGKPRHSTIQCGRNGTPISQILSLTTCPFFRNINLTCIWTAMSTWFRMLITPTTLFRVTLFKSNYSYNMQLSDIFITLNFKSMSAKAIRSHSLESQACVTLSTKKVTLYTRLTQECPALISINCVWQGLAWAHSPTHRTFTTLGPRFMSM